MASWSWSISTLRMSVRDAHWSRRRPGHPAVEAGQRAVQRLHLADVAAEEPLLDRPEEQVRPVPVDEALQLHAVGREELEPQARIPLSQLLDEVVGLLGQPARVDREDPDDRVDAVGHVDQRDIAVLERRRQGEPVPEAADRPLEDVPGLETLELDRQLPRLEIVQQLGAAHAAASSLRLRAGSRPTSRPSSSSVVLSRNARRLSPVRAPVEPATDEPVHQLVELTRRHPPEHRPGDRRARPERAAQVHVVGLAALPRLVAHGRALEPDVPDPVLGARVRAAVEVQPERRNPLAESLLEAADQLVEPRLRLGHRVVAVRLPGAGDPVAAQPVHLQRQVELAEGGDDPVDLALRDVREQQVLLARDPRLGAERLEEVAERDEPRTAEQADVHGDADARQPVLRLRR